MSARPNIILLQTDQQRWDAVGYANALVQTPHLDALARQGIRFDQVVCQAPMCLPSRHALMTGLYPSQSGSRNNTQFFARDAEMPLPVLAQRLQALGYQTAGFGKMHWFEGEPWFDPALQERSTRGFEVRVTVQAGEDEGTARTLAKEEPKLAEALTQEKKQFGGGGEDPAGYVGVTSQFPAEQQREGWLTRQALDFLKKGRDGRPLFFFLSFNTPHPGFGIPPGYEERYKIEDIPDRPLPPWLRRPQEHVPAPDRWSQAWEKMSPLERRRTTLRYWAYCSFCDDLFGQALKGLEASGDLKDALILFTSDHGEMLGDRQHRFSKYCLYEGAVRVPFLLSGSRVPADLRGSLDSRPAGHVDLLPTVLEALGQSVPPELPGRSLLASGDERGGSFSELHGTGYEERIQAPTYMWRTKRWKLILHLPGELKGAETRLDSVQGELFDLEKDPEEWQNLYDEGAFLEVRDALKTQLLMHLAVAWAKFPKKMSFGES